MRHRNWALACSAFALMLSVSARADIASYQLGDGTHEDWEPAIVADGSYVYALWPHFLATTYRDSSGATCMPFSPKGAGKNNTTSAYMYFQSSSDGGTTWSSVSIPRCPVYGNVVDAPAHARGPDRAELEAARQRRGAILPGRENGEQRRGEEQQREEHTCRFHGARF